MRDGHWIFGSVFCRVNMFTNCVTVSYHPKNHLLTQFKTIFCQVNASVFTLLAMTLERYRAIMTPLAPRNSHTTLWIGIGLIWSCSAILALPSAFASTIFVQVAACSHSFIPVTLRVKWWRQSLSLDVKWYLLHHIYWTLCKWYILSFETNTEATRFCFKATLYSCLAWRGTRKVGMGLWVRRQQIHKPFFWSFYFFQRVF